MKRGVVLFLIPVLLCALVGCEDIARGATDTTVPSVTEKQEQTGTEQEILAMFYEYAESDWVVLDCVAVSDSSFGFTGVVQYTTDDYEGCCFDFLTEGGMQRCGVGAHPAEETALEYAGNDTVTCRLLHPETGEPYICTISFIAKENEVCFRIVG